VDKWVIFQELVCY